MSEEWSNRLVLELAELKDRLEKLRSFVGTVAFTALPIKDQLLLERQEEYMTRYHTVLDTRVTRATYENGQLVPWKKYTRTGISKLRPYILGEDITDISVSPEDNPEEDMGMIAINPDNSKDQWYVAREYFDKNYVESPDAKE